MLHFKVYLRAVKDEKNDLYNDCPRHPSAPQKFEWLLEIKMHRIYYIVPTILYSIVKVSRLYHKWNQSYEFWKKWGFHKSVEFEERGVITAPKLNFETWFHFFFSINLLRIPNFKIWRGVVLKLILFFFFLPDLSENIYRSTFYFFCFNFKFYSDIKKIRFKLF